MFDTPATCRGPAKRRTANRWHPINPAGHDPASGDFRLTSQLKRIFHSDIQDNISYGFLWRDQGPMAHAKHMAAFPSSPEILPWRANCRFGKTFARETDLSPANAAGRLPPGPAGAAR